MQRKNRNLGHLRKESAAFLAVHATRCFPITAHGRLEFHMGPESVKLTAVFQPQRSLVALELLSETANSKSGTEWINR